MKTKTTLLILFAMIIASCSVESDENQKADDGVTNDDDVILYQDDLITGQNIIVGTVIVSVAADGTLTITYETDSDWQIDETHLFVGTLGDLPTNGSGNPLIGQFTYSSIESDGTTSVVYTTTLAEGECVYIAAHAVVTNTATGQNETAWGNGVQINSGGGSWSMMFEVCN